MDDLSPRNVRIIGQLAQEYEEKYRQLEALVSKTAPQEAIPQLRALAERTTDRFRAAQMALLSIQNVFEGEEGEQALAATTALCSAFDELRILFQALSDTTQDRCPQA
ncbi:MAG: hypothetical protein AAGU11_16020 [Syntrophobacteraceae bacterium]